MKIPNTVLLTFSVVTETFYAPKCTPCRLQTADHADHVDCADCVLFFSA